VHVTDFVGLCVQYVDNALKEDSLLARTARELVSKIKGETDDGVRENVDEFERLSDLASSQKLIVSIESERKHLALRKSTSPASPSSQADFAAEVREVFREKGYEQDDETLLRVLREHLPTAPAKTN
jgi:hypothetical protein